MANLVLPHQVQQFDYQLERMLIEKLIALSPLNLVYIIFSYFFLKD